MRPCCRCQALLYHTGVQTTVSSYRMVHHGVSVTYTLFGYPGSQPHLFLSLSLSISRFLSLLRCPLSSFYSFLEHPLLPPARWRPECTLPRGSCRTVAPATKMFCETNVCIRTLDRPRNPIAHRGTGGDVNRRRTFDVFVITPSSPSSVVSALQNVGRIFIDSGEKSRSGALFGSVCISDRGVVLATEDLG